MRFATKAFKEFLKSLPAEQRERIDREMERSRDASEPDGEDQD